MRVKKMDLLDWGDMLTAGIPLGYTFGRLGNFINGELYGRVTKAPWGIVFPHAETFSGNLPWVRDFAAVLGIPVNGAAAVNLPRHPSQLYEALFEGVVLWLILWFIVRKRKPYNGFVIAAYMVGYGVFRFLIEYVREPDADIGYPIRLVSLGSPAQFSLFNFTTGQILNVLLIAGGVAVALVASARARKVSALESSPVLTARKVRKRLR
jgi:phosphatidylglycerol:prolipoprotein diacylglycerol transferase